MSASLSIIFSSPLFGFLMPIEKTTEEDEEMVFPKSSKIVLYFTTIIGGLLCFQLLNVFSLPTSGMPRFTNFSLGKNEYILAVPLAIAGGIIGISFFLFEHLFKKILKRNEKLKNIMPIICGLILGIIGMYLPILLFSGEHEIHTLMVDYAIYSFPILFIIGILKLALAPFCIHSGWIGGHIFPVIFSGVSLGYAFSLILPVDPIFSVAMLTASVVGVIMRKPLAVALLLLLCFPVKTLIWLFIAAFIGSKIPAPFQKK